MKTAAALLCLFITAQEPVPDRSDELIRLLSDDELAVRENATRELDRLGVPALGKLRKAWKDSSDPEVQSRLISIVRGIETRSGIAAKRVTLEISWPDPPPGRWEFNTQKVQFTLRVRNANEYEVLVRPRFGLKLADAAGRDVRLRHGIWPGEIEPGCMLKFAWNDDFIAVPGGAAADVTENLADFRHEDTGGCIGWWLDAPGDYGLTATWAFDRKAFKGRCPLGCKGHDDPAAPWNQAVEAGGEVKATIHIAAGRPIACEADLKKHGPALIEHASRGHVSGLRCPLCPNPARNFWGCGEKHPATMPEAACCYWCAGEKGICAICKAPLEKK